MKTLSPHLDPPCTLGERLQRLNDSLQDLGERLKTAFAEVIGATIADAVRDAICCLLGGQVQPTTQRQPQQPQQHHPYQPWDEQDHHQHQHHQADWQDGLGQSWQEEDDWAEEPITPPPQEPPSRSNPKAKRWQNALSAGLQTALWWLKHQPARRPVLTTVAVTLVAGVTGFIAGPAVAAGVGVLASVAGLLLTTDASHTVVDLFAR